MPLPLAQHVPVGQHAGLGAAGRPGGEEQHRRRERVDVDDLLERARRGQVGVRDFVVQRGFRRRTVVHQHQGERRQVFRGLAEHADERSVHDDEAAAGQLQLVGQEPPDERGVERHAHRAEVGEGEGADHLLGAVAHQQPDGRALLDPELAQPVRHAPYRLGGLAVGQLGRGRTEERLVRRPSGVPEQQLDDPRRVTGGTSGGGHVRSLEPRQALGRSELSARDPQDFFVRRAAPSSQRLAKTVRRGTDSLPRQGTGEPSVALLVLLQKGIAVLQPPQRSVSTAS